MGGVDHDGRSKFPPDRSRGGLRGVGRAEDLADFAHGVDALVDKGDALLRTGLVATVGGAFARLQAGHEFYDGFPMLAAGDRTEEIAHAALHILAEWKAEFALASHPS